MTASLVDDFFRHVLTTDNQSVQRGCQCAIAPWLSAEAIRSIVVSRTRAIDRSPDWLQHHAWAVSVNEDALFHFVNSGCVAARSVVQRVDDTSRQAETFCHRCVIAAPQNIHYRRRER
jgi:hypothetical protein